MDGGNSNHENSLSNKNSYNLVSRIRKISPKRTLLYTAMFLLSLWLVLLLFITLQKDNYKSELQQVRTDLQAQSSSISSLTTPDKIEKGQIDSALGYIIDESKKIQYISAPALPSNTILTLLKPLDTSWRNDINSLSMTKIDSQTNALLGRHASILETLRSILSYNPQADLAADSLTQEDISQRVAAAKEGISATKIEIDQQPPYAEDNLAAVSEALEELQNSLNGFDQSRDKNAWYKAVDTAQDKIIANRQSFWTTERDKLLTEYAVVNQLVSNLIVKL